MSRAFGEFTYKGEFPRRTMLARIMRAEPVGKGRYGRTSFELDAIDVRAAGRGVERVLADAEALWPLAVLRVVTTEKRFAQILDGRPAEGSWVELELEPKKRGRPIVYHSQLREDGYTDQSRGTLGRARLLFHDVDKKPMPGSAGAMAASIFNTARQLAIACRFPPSAVRSSQQIAARLAKLRAAHHVIVRDVGQASFVALAGKSDVPLLYVDAGWPISFNGRTAPKRLPPVQDNVPVILSHWDFDHLLGFYRFPVLRENHWLVPVQQLGPGARRIADLLHAKKRLHGYRGPDVSGGFGTLRCCNGKHPMNDSGLAVEARLVSGRDVLIVGDAAYSAVPGHPSPDFLVATHHGAVFEGPVPRPRRPEAPCVVSVGKGNVYRHPRPEALARHIEAKWSIEMTCHASGRRRGDRKLGP